MKRLLYIGNQLNHKQSTVTSIDVLGPLLESEGYQLRYASPKIHKWLRLLDMLRAVYANRKWSDFVLIDTYSTLNFYYAFAVSQLCRMSQLKYIPILHGGDLPKRLKSHPKMCWAIFKPAYVNIAPSEYTASLFRTLGYTHIKCIPNSIRLAHYPFKQRSYEAIHLLWVRSFADIYNPLLAIDILKTLQDHGVKASLSMVGPDRDGTLQKARAHAKTLGVTVNFTGKLSKSDWIALSQTHNVFINTTNIDNMPVSVIEAMALGLVVISTNVGGLPYLISHQETGILVPPNRVQGFVEGIEQIQSHPERANEMIKKARAQVEQYDWNVVRKQWNSVLQP
ncbi:glycosyltransferase family 4 protein [Gaetbulibacter saemankumensis]|uniref:glycosyltransferase family 4 protein n=1 Tax=Gaetbulibacter saemankumensis TaxID=311208 RepID=UPI000404E2E4|nr:glycosyltransferase family 4 protein [Gaetbulibacter saemankumensis]